MEDTQPTRTMDMFQRIPVQPAINRKKRSKRGRKIILFILFLIAFYFLAPLRTNIILLGTDDSPERGNLGRTDTIILTTIVPLKPYVGMLSIPRDLWVTIPNVGEQRINTAYFFAEANQAGTGGKAVMQTIRQNFGVRVSYYVVIRMAGVVNAVDSLGGVDITLDASAGKYPAGTFHLSGSDALVFVRDRSGSSDFARMQRTQILMQAMLKKGFAPSSWPRLPQFILSVFQVIDTNIPIWQWPRLTFVLMRAQFVGMDSRTITPDMVIPFQTSGGAQVLAPNWERVNPLIRDMFGR
jgi:polyisoprenyl-teichoic acid--peptidoglycan teichoic acid transferase